jgi:arginase
MRVASRGVPLPLSVVGVPTSAGAFAPGQEQAPTALRDAGLLDRLRAAGLDVTDRGDCERYRWRPDREHPRAQNAAAVAGIVRDTARRVGEAAAGGDRVLVLGGDCTVGIGAIAGQREVGASVGVVYFDAHADLNTPDSVHEGALDWMGMAHMLAEDGAVPEVAGAVGEPPLLEPEQVVLLGWDAGQATGHERAAIERLSLAVVPAEEVRADPSAAASRALHALVPRVDRLVVHFDVDVVDFTDTPLSENGGRNEGVPYAAASAALATLCASPAVSGLTVTELNPDHVEEGAGTLERLTADLAGALAVRTEASP